MSRNEIRNVIIRRIPLDKIRLNDLTDSELQEIISKMEADMEDEAYNRGLQSTLHLFAYIALNYAMRLYQIEHLEKTRQKAEEKRLDETIEKLKDFFKKP